jgi:hypothetical protein
MSYDELRGWAKYLAKEPVNSIEAQLALVAQVSANSFGGKAKFDDMFFTNYKVTPKVNTEAKPMSVSSIRSKFSNVL